jgi:hypothetical protein
MKATLAACTVLAVLAVAVPASASERVDSAYWWIGQSDGSAPAPTTVPPGGLYVGSTPAGSTAVSAVRLVLDPGEAAQSLSLTVHQVQKVDALSIDAYVTSTAWKAGDAQSWSTAPTPPAGATALHGVLQPDALTLVFDLRSVTCTSPCSLLLVPGAPKGAPTAGLAPAATFDATFERVTPEALLITRPPSGASVPPPVVTPEPVETQAPALGGLSPALPLGPPPALPGPAVVPSPTPVPPALAPAAAAQPQKGARSGRDVTILSLLLAAVAFYLGWRARAALAEGAARTTIYDLPPDA